MTWNYRIVRHPEAHWFEIAEVYYEDGVPESWAKAQPAGDSISDIAQDLVWMVEALSRPVLDLNTDHTFREGQR